MSDDEPNPTAETQVRETIVDDEVDGAGRNRLEVLSAGDPTSGERRIGRYIVLGTLGQGGMGKVLRAHDETLGRDVALKMLHDTRGPDHEQRLLREAQALARLSHPNVIQVFDVETIDGRLCMSMELVQGEPLDRWHRKPRRWPEVLEIYRQAGEGLAAAHAEGIVHRDFKPANCILDARGVVKVLDFGLARGTSTDDEAEAQHTIPNGTSPVQSLGDSLRASSSQAMLELDLTRTGAMLGTPAYMAPEQLLGKAAEPASDQFAFCVSLYEALYGRRPFPGNNAAAILYSIQNRVPSSTLAQGGLPPVPRWLFEVLRRGMAVPSHQRFPSMRAVLDALRQGLTRRRRARIGAAVGLSGVALVSALSLGGLLERERPCADLWHAPMPGWGSEDRAAVQAALEATGLPDAGSIQARVEAELDAYAQAWITARAEACEATWVRHAAGEQVLARRVACLDERLPHVRAIVDRLGEADATTASLAVGAVDALPTIEPCRDVEALLRGAPPIPEHRVAEATEVRGLIARSWAANVTGDESGLDLAARAVEAAAALPEAPTLEIDARLNHGYLLRHARWTKEAREELQRALEQAELLDDHARVIDVLRELILLADQERDANVAEAWLTVIRGKLARLEDRPRRRAERWALEGLVALRAHRLGEAIEAGARAVELYDAMEDAPLDEHFDALLLLGDAHTQSGDEAAARAAFERALALVEDSGRLMLPAKAHYKLGYLDYSRGHLDQAREALERALQGERAFHGPQTFAVVRPRLLLAQILRLQGENDLALEQASKAWSSLDERSPPPLRAALGSLLGSLHRSNQQWDQAIARYREARAAWTAADAPDRVEMALLDSNIADCLVAKGALDDAQPLYEGTVRILEIDTPSDDPRRAYPLLGLGELSLAQGDPAAAVAPLRAVLGLHAAIERDPSLAATTRWDLAQALRPDPSASPEATLEAASLARKARDAFDGAGIHSTVEEIDAWLAACGAPCALPFDPMPLPQSPPPPHQTITPSPHHPKSDP